jgi:amino acid adenylation domain-containing protein
MPEKLHDFARRAAARWPSCRAVDAPDRSVTYAELDVLANRYATLLCSHGVARGSRVGIYLDKSADAVVAMQAVLRLGAAYVPLDPLGPVVRAATIAQDAMLAAVITTSARGIELGNLGVRCPTVRVDAPNLLEGIPTEAFESIGGTPNDLAYILYTSGSTGTPKGVCISHRNATAFVDWCVDTLRPDERDVFANHAPFHFDLSVLDMYTALSVGASVALVPDALSYHPPNLVSFLGERKITIWYSVPTAIVMMLEKGGLLDASNLVLRAICFAGEVFPMKYLARLQKGLPGARLLNLYGPTETNVCTYYEVTGSLEGRTSPLPIGRACSGDRVWAEGEHGEPIQDGEEGELVVDGPTVMLGYWGQEPQAGRPYRTGDRVRREPDGDYVYLGRRDQMVKVRGYRIELGEIEAALAGHPAIREVAVAVRGTGIEAKLVAFAVRNGEWTPGTRGPGLVALKELCAEKLPRQMNIDSVIYLESLPRTRNGKVDRQRLAELFST